MAKLGEWEALILYVTLPLISFLFLGVSKEQPGARRRGCQPPVSRALVPHVFTGIPGGQTLPVPTFLLTLTQKQQVVVMPLLCGRHFPICVLIQPTAKQLL